METARSAVVVGGSALGGAGGTGVVGYGVHRGTDKSIGKAIGSEFLPDDNNNTEWGELLTLLKSHESDGDYGLKELAANSSTNNDALKSWCEKQKGYSWGSLVYQNKGYVSRVRRYCIYTIYMKLSKEASSNSLEILPVGKQDNDGDFKTNFGKLKSMSSGDNNGNGNYSKDSELKDIKEKFSNDESKGSKALRGWCGKAFDKGWVSDNNNPYLLVKYLCTKAKSQVAS